MEQHKPGEFFESERPSLEHNATKGIVWSDFTGLIALFHACFERISATQRKKQIERLLSAANWFEHYKDKTTGRRVLAEDEKMEFPDELVTAIVLTQINYDVVFAPRAMFRQEEKKFDIFLIRDTIILKADLKFVTGKNPNTIAQRIIKGSEQAPRVVIHINSDFEKKDLIDGLRSGVERNNLIKEVLLIYKRKFYRLTKLQIVSKNIFKILK